MPSRRDQLCFRCVDARRRTTCLSYRFYEFSDATDIGSDTSVVRLTKYKPCLVSYQLILEVFGSCMELTG